MSKETFARAIERELEKLNRTIDKKIVKGVPYLSEARRHKLLLNQLTKVGRMYRGGWLSFA